MCAHEGVCCTAGRGRGGRYKQGVDWREIDPDLKARYLSSFCNSRRIGCSITKGTGLLKLVTVAGSWALTPDLGDSFQSLAGKRVLSVGLGESGSDIPRSRLHSVASAGACRAPGPSARASLLT